MGVDIEYVEPLPDLEGVASAFFSTRELGLLHLLPERERLVAFFTCWTRKEAYLKALGEGLTRSANRVEVCADFSQTTELNEIDNGEGENRFWRIETIVPAPGYLGAVAVEGRGWDVSWLDW
ncbi:MAG: 4'-phosphopantetheinyl transferase superfamily protein [Candidatus Dormibacteraeota bacterium]|nr:4'-phosphopantetheinyl transferase superfamily protein [Candidatus Dormibacteraeota bacterium]